MGVKRLFVLSILLTSMAGCSEPNRSGGSEIVSGEDFFKQRCAECHGLDGTASISGAVDLSTSTISDELIKEVIENGRNSMPSFKILIDSEETMDETVEFVKSLRK